MILKESKFFDLRENENLFYNYNEIKKLKESLELSETDFLKILYFNKKNINSILLKEDKIIRINDKKIEKIFIFSIYLCILIEDNINIVNYEYDFELINKLNIEKKKENNRLKKIIISKLIDILINNYEGVDIKHKMNEINEIKNENKAIMEVKENIDTLKKYNLDEKDIYQKKIEDIYLEIIKTLIKDQELNEDKFLELDLEFELIIFNKDKLKKILNIIDRTEEYKKKYEISEFNDLFPDKMIFYHAFIKYVLKHPFYIYLNNQNGQDSFSAKTIKGILNLIKDNKDNLSTFIDNKDKDGNLKEKVVYVLKSFIVYEYYYQESKKKKNDDDNNKSNINRSSNLFSLSNISKEISNDNKSFGMEVRNGSNDNKSFGMEVRNGSEDQGFDENDLAYKILKKSIFKFNINRNGQEASIKYDEIKIGDNGDKINNFDEIEKYSSQNIVLKKKYDIFMDRLKKIKNRIIEKLGNKDNLTFIIEFSKNEENSKQDNINGIEIKCNYRIENPQSHGFDELELNIEDNKILGEGIPMLDLFLRKINNYQK